ncbi:type II toxin-antitoxin system Phd/YefM family antitoxin [Sulfurimonas sp. SAG-AH-194-L11]|nr:type II toxin-antitoxin system Phd/YefM family antitoxin [Sulfurimonas sp. SAG-AH-194-L11]MDF1877659.1 type II toxin-antitoxin system Phd/YefM family antitoxin [Sulfurimonas sp. SAG-AH-194-L11]
MIAYTRDEIISASEISRSFSSVLNDLISYTKDRFVISKNNKLEAVVLPIEEYERMQEALDFLEHMEIYNVVKERENSKTIPLSDVMKELGISEDDL